MKCITDRIQKIRIGTTEKCDWKTLYPGKIYELSEDVIRQHGLQIVEETKLEKIITAPVTEGKIRKKKVETKQFEDYTLNLTKIKGVGSATRKALRGEYPTEKELIKAIRRKEELPTTYDVEKKLRRKYGTKRR